MDVPVWALAGAVFLLRVGDVSLGTLRTLVVVQGRVLLAMGLGFIELLVWVTALSQVISHLGEHPMLAVAYAAGFACGNGAGILLERRLAMGHTALRFITKKANEITAAIHSLGTVLAAIDGEADGGGVSLVYATCRRRDLRQIIERARAVDPGLFYVVERFSETSRLTPLAPVTGWRAVLKKK